MPVDGPATSAGRFAAIRLPPGQDLRTALEAMRARLDAPAMAIATCVGSLDAATLRLAGRTEGTRLVGSFEIVSLTGTLGRDGPHLHAAIADPQGRVVGGHVLPGCTVRTTAEIVAILLDDLAFARAPCPLSGYDELLVRPTGRA
jgi:predicted DNA-binding protein with PD1-like motif